MQFTIIVMYFYFKDKVGHVIIKTESKSTSDSEKQHAQLSKKWHERVSKLTLTNMKLNLLIFNQF